MSDDITRAHEALQDLFRGEDTTYPNPLGVTLEFHEWAEARGYDVDISDLREKHVWMDYRLEEPVARLVLEWVEELPDQAESVDTLEHDVGKKGKFRGVKWDKCGRGVSAGGIRFEMLTTEIQSSANSIAYPDGTCS